MDDTVRSDVSLANSPAPADESAPERPERGGLAAAMACSAGLIVLVIAGAMIGVNASTWAAMIFALDAALILIAAVLALANGEGIPHWLGALLLWAAFGLTLSLMIIAIFSIGLVMGIPLIFIGFGLKAWPRPAGQSIFSVPGMLAQVAGFLMLPVAIIVTTGF